MTEIVLLDAESHRREALAEQLREHGLKVVAVESAPTGIIGACVLCIDAPDHNFWAHLLSSNHVLLLNTEGSIADAVKAIHQGAADYLSWPTPIEELLAAIERAAKSSTAGAADALENFPLIGESVAMRELKEQIGKAGPTESTVLIRGQSGTGKELVARAIHASSTRAGAAMISMNCATVPANLVEAELFGSESLLDDQPSVAGLVETANGGTLFLDEIAELPEAAQAKLVRVLDGENRRVGSTTTHPVDVRLIAATHQDLKQMVSSGQFREDLFYRLNVICLELQPLRARQDDVLSIADWLLDRTSQRLQKSGLSFSAQARQAMLEYHWPGNVRELENAVERAVILSDPETAISQKLLAIEPQLSATPEAPVNADGEPTSLEDYFIQFVQQHQDQLTETELAEKLGISRKSLWERRQRLNIPRRKTRKRGTRQG